MEILLQGIPYCNVIIKHPNIMKNHTELNPKPPFLKTAVMRCCNLCQNFRHEEVGDSDYGAVYAKEASCSEYYDIDEETEEDQNFDREISRDCGVLDFFKVCEIDSDLADKLSEEMDRTVGSFSETYKTFCKRYNNA